MIGVVTVAVVPVGVASVTVVIGVLTLTVAVTVTGNVGIGSVDRRAVLPRDTRTGATVAAPPEPSVRAATAAAVGPSLVLA